MIFAWVFDWFSLAFSCVVFAWVFDWVFAWFSLVFRVVFEVFSLGCCVGFRGVFACFLRGVCVVFVWFFVGFSLVVFILCFRLLQCSRFVLCDIEEFSFGFCVVLFFVPEPCFRPSLPLSPLCHSLRSLPLSALSAPCSKELVLEEALFSGRPPALPLRI